MPVKFDMIVKVKFWHALLYIGISNVVMINIMAAAYAILKIPFSLTDFIAICFMMVIFSVSVSVFLIFIDMFIDTINPKLNWENPMSATKQNFNVLWSMLISMLTIVILLLLIIFVLPKKMISIVILSILYVIISAPVGAGYFRYAEKRLQDM